MKLICIGRNYTDHIKELENEKPTDPVVFLKPDTSIYIGYVPSFRAFLANYNKFLVVHYGNGKWWKYAVPHHKDNKQWVPAISLTLSN